MPTDQPASYIVLPRSGLFPRTEPERTALEEIGRGATRHPDIAPLMAELAGATTLDTCATNGMSLVSLTAAQAGAVNASAVPLRAVADRAFGRGPRHLAAAHGFVAATGPITLTIACHEAVTGKPIADRETIALTDAAAGTGARGRTDADGRLVLHLATPRIEQLFVYGDPGFWGAYRTDLTVADGDELRLDFAPIDLAEADPLRHYYGNSDFDPAAGVVVGTVDTGVGQSSQLNVSGTCLVPGEDPTDFHDVAEHGTFGAGLIGANGVRPEGVRGIAPGVVLRAYRVFDKQAVTSTYLVIKGLLQAVADDCDVINLALGAGTQPEADFAEAIGRVRDAGTIVIAGAGNEFRSGVSYPGKYPGALAVGALGRRGTFPAGSVIEADILYPPVTSAHPDEFIGNFANLGPEVQALGLGSGVVSILPGGGIGAWSGSSVAVPVAVGVMACLLSRRPDILAMPRNRARSDAMEALLLRSATPRGFGSAYEGSGLPAC